MVGRQPAIRTGPGTIDPIALGPRLVASWLADDRDRRHRRVDGALVFLDISGFTRLTESLATLGSRGAEEIRDVINTTFTALLDRAYEDGASLLKFGGDAVLLLFEGDRAAVRAARAAHRMRDALHAGNPVRTSGGKIELGATIGVAAGPVDLLLVGDSHRELFVLGATASQAIRLESRAEPDEIVVSPSVAVMLHDDEVATTDHGHRLLGCPNAGPLAPAPPIVDTDETRTWLGVPEQLRDHLLGGSATGQHRHATIAFVKLSGTDELMRRAPVDAITRVARLTSAVQRACRHHDVTWLSSDADADGLKVILLAGIPTGDDDDSDRLVHAVRQVVGEVSDLDLRVGIHRGGLFSGLVGPPYRLTFTVLGDAVNLAARTVARAQPGQVLATTAVLNGLQTLTDVEMLTPFHVKGKALPVRAGIVGEELGTRLRRRGDTRAFVGRTSELDELVQAVDEAQRGSGSAIELVGPAGIGKSRLVDELQDQRPRFPMHLVACTRFASERPYRAAAMLLRLVLTGERHGPPEPVVSAARNLARGTDLEPLVPLLGIMLDTPVPATAVTSELDPAHVPARVREVATRLLAAALPGPAGLVVEDAHWLDPESRELFASLAATAGHRPWLLVFTARSQLDLPATIRQQSIGPLDDETARAFLLSYVDDGVVTLDRVDDLVERSSGNPLFLAELAQAIDLGHVPDDIDTLVRRRIDRLEPGAARLLAHAAVLGVEFPPELLEAAAAADPGIDETVSLRAIADFVRPMRSGHLRFRQSLYQEVVYATLPFRERRRLHGQAAVALGRLDGADDSVLAEARSRHHHLAGDYRRSWEYSRQALHRAHERAALGSAARLARRAIEAASRTVVPTDERAAVWERLGDVLEQAGSYGEALAAYRRARSLVRPSPWLCRKSGHVRERRGEYSSALRWYTIGRRETEGDLAERVALEMRRCITLLRQGRVAEAADLSIQALPMADEIADERLAGYLHYVRAWALSELGEPDHDMHRERAVELFERTGDLRGLSLLANEVGAAAYYAGDWDGAISAYRRAMRMLERLGDSVQAAATRANIGEILVDQGHLNDGIDTLESALRLLQVAHHGVGIMLTQGFLGRAVARAGDLHRADELYAAALESAREGHAPGVAQEMLVRRAEVAVFAGDVDRARRHLAAAAEFDQAGRPPTLRAVQARVEGVLAILEGDMRTAAARFEDSLATARSVGLVYEAGLTLAAQGALLGEDESRRAADDALRPLGVVMLPAVLAAGPLLASCQGADGDRTRKERGSPAWDR